MSRLLYSFLLITVAGAVGCMGQPDIEAQSADTHFDYQPPEAESPVDITFLMLEPRLRSASEPGTLGTELHQQSAEMVAMFQQQAKSSLEDFDPETNPFQRKYIETYQPQLEAALKRDLQKMLKTKGFRAVETFGSYEEISSEQRREALLLAVPTATVALTRDIASTNCGPRHCTEEGRLKLDGQFLFLMVEPESGGIFGVRRVNLSLQDISEPYTRHTLRDGNGGNETTSESRGKLLDTSDKALVEVLNRFYTSMLNKMDGLLYRRKILAFNSHMRALSQENEK